MGNQFHRPHQGHKSVPEDLPGWQDEWGLEMSSTAPMTYEHPPVRSLEGIPADEKQLPLQQA